MRKHITSMLYIMVLALLFCAPMAGAEEDDPKSPHAPGAAMTPVDRKCEMELAQGQMWVNMAYLKAGKEYKFGATGDNNVTTIGLYIKRPHHECVEKHREGMMENEDNMLGTKMMENHESMGDKEAKILMQSVGDAPTLCFTPDVDGHYKFKAVLQALSPDAQHGKVTITIKEGCSPSLF